MHKPVTTALFLGAAISAYSVPVQAQAQVQSFDIPAGSVKTALDGFARQTGVQIIYREADLRSRSSPGVRGTMPADLALRMLLDETGLVQQQGRTGAIAIVPAARMSPIAYQTEQSTGSRSAAAPPAAPQAPSDESAAYGDIIVTAQRKEQRLQDVPVSLSVTSGETLTKSNISDLQDLSVRLPGVRISTVPGANLLNVRGIGSGINAGFEQSVGTFVDGLYRGRSRAASAALFDVDRVEVLKGPQTTFFGNNVIAGALNITTRKPGSEFGFNASALYAPAHKEYAYEAGIDLPVSDALRFRVAGKAFGMDGWNYNSLTGESEPHKRDWIGRISMEADPFDTWQVQGRVDHGRIRDRGYFSAELLGCPPGGNFPPQPGLPQPSLCNRYLLANGGVVDGQYDRKTAYHDSLFRLNYTEVGLTNRIEMGDHVLTSITGYYDHDNRVLTDAAPVPFNLPFFPTTLGVLPLDLSEQVKQYSQELRLEGPTSGMFEYMAGVYYGHEKIDAMANAGFYFAPFGLSLGLPIDTPVAAVNVFHQKSDTYSAFASVSFKPTTALRINVGARYSIVNKRAFNDAIYGTAVPEPSPENFVPFPANQTSAAFPTPAAFFSRLDALVVAERGNFSDPTRTDRKFMPSLNIQYEINPDMSAYASYTKGFKAGGFANAFLRNTFGPENVNAYEMGLKANLLDRHLFVTLAAFLSDYKGLQEATQNILPPVAGPPTVALPARFVNTILNAASSRSKGIEFGMNLRATDWLGVNAEVTYLDARYKDFTGAPCTLLGNVVGASAGCINGTQDLSGKRKGYAPEWSGNIGANLTIPVRDDFQITLNPSLYFTSKYFFSSTADPLVSQAGYAKIDLRGAIGAADGSWEFAIIAKNLTDKKTATFSQGLVTSAGTTWIGTERPRSVAFQFTVRR